MKKVILILITIFQLTSCREPFTRFNDEVEYNEFKENLVEPENYSFILHYNNDSTTYSYKLDEFKGFYSIKLSKINLEYQFYLSNFYFEKHDYNSEELYEKEISEEKLIELIGEENLIKRISDCFPTFEKYQKDIISMDKKNPMLTASPAQHFIVGTRPSSA